jgi:glycosyltransferase involved in cell wall biosynthesis
VNQRATVLLLIPHLGGGGAERIAALLAERLDPGKYHVHLGLVIAGNTAGIALPPQVTVHALGARRTRYGMLWVLRLVRKLRPDVLLCGMAHLNLAVLLLRPFFPRQTRVLVRQNSAPRAGDAGMLSTLLYRTLYRRADAVICQSGIMAGEVARAARWTANLHVLANPVDLKAIRSRTRASNPHWRGPGPHLLAVGRLAPEKGFDLLLRATALLRYEHRFADLAILGAGREEERLRVLTRRLALEKSVRFAGHVPEPQAWFPGATVFVLSSLREGVPNALLEAAAAGLPIVATPADGGLSELLAGKEGVWLADDISAAALERAIVSALNALRAGELFRHGWIEEFRTERAIPRFEALIDSVLAGTP